MIINIYVFYFAGVMNDKHFVSVVLGWLYLFCCVISKAIHGMWIIKFKHYFNVIFTNSCKNKHMAVIGLNILQAIGLMLGSMKTIKVFLSVPWTF